ncbi:hypothetical protein [Hydrotalea sp.]|uniref:hypothetical protein n=1 Tax=Hydrotalea sp. TaxID=2881279 RepID=UPI003D0E6E55
MSNREKSPHILNASSNLLGICFILLASLKVMKIAEKTFIDEVTTMAIILFMCSCILSFISIRTNNSRSHFYENMADIIFMMGLSLLFITTLLYSFNVIK